MKRLSDYIPARAKEVNVKKNSINTKTTFQSNKRKSVPVIKKIHDPMATIRTSDLYYEDNPKSGYFSEQTPKKGYHYSVEYTDPKSKTTVRRKKNK